MVQKYFWLQTFRLYDCTFYHGQLVRVIDRSAEIPDLRTFLDMTYCDFISALDKKNSSPPNCNTLGVKDLILVCTRAFLKARKRNVANGAASLWQDLSSDSYHGFVLGPLLFVFYIGQSTIVRSIC